MYTTLDVTAFPFDRQTLDFHMTINVNSSTGGDIEIIPSAAGLKLYTGGAGDDVSGWDAQDIIISSQTQKYFQPYSDAVLGNPLRPSHPDDPAPLVPAPGTNVRPYGDDIQTTMVTLSVVVKRLSLFFGISIILPVGECGLFARSVGGRSGGDRIELTQPYKPSLFFSRLHAHQFHRVFCRQQSHRHPPSNMYHAVSCAGRCPVGD